MLCSSSVFTCHSNLLSDFHHLPLVLFCHTASASSLLCLCLCLPCLSPSIPLSAIPVLPMSPLPVFLSCELTMLLASISLSASLCLLSPSACPIHQISPAYLLLVLYLPLHHTSQGLKLQVRNIQFQLIFIVLTFFNRYVIILLYWGEV
jgi:hypothetical protein